LLQRARRTVSVDVISKVQASAIQPASLDMVSRPTTSVVCRKPLSAHISSEEVSK